MRKGRPVGRTGMGSFGGGSGKVEVPTELALGQSQALNFVRAGMQIGVTSPVLGLRGLRTHVPWG